MNSPNFRPLPLDASVNRRMSISALFADEPSDNEPLGLNGDDRSFNANPIVVQVELLCSFHWAVCEQGPSSHVFMTERDGPMTRKAFHALSRRIGERAEMPCPVHPHM
jgi:hypothetical protein